MVPILLPFLLLSVIGGNLAPSSHAIDFDRCYTLPNHHCSIELPSQVPPGAQVTATHVHIILPDSNAAEMIGVLSSDNFTHLQQNPAIMYVESYSVSVSPNLNYCPTALQILLGQDGYLSKVRNFTDLIYPNWCTPESGPNPLPVPEFPFVLLLVGVAFISIIFLYKVKIWK